MSELAINKPRELLRGIISDMQVFREQVSSLNDLKDELKKAQRDVETWTHNLKMIKHEFAEVEGAIQKYQQQGVELGRKLDALNAEIRTKTGERDQIVAEVQRIRGLIQQW
jgi:chromosome segregation ATPase